MKQYQEMEKFIEEISVKFNLSEIVVRGALTESPDKYLKSTEQCSATTAESAKMEYLSLASLSPMRDKAAAAFLKWLLLSDIPDARVAFIRCWNIRYEDAAVRRIAALYKPQTYKRLVCV